MPYIISHNRYQNHLSYQLYGVKPVNSKLHNISINSPRNTPNCSNPYYFNVLYVSAILHTLCGLSGSYSCQILVTKIFLSEILFVRTYPLWAFVCGNISIIISTMMAGRSFCYSSLFPPRGRGYESLSFHLELPSL